MSSDDNDRKIIKIAMSDDDNENAFQQGIGLGAGMIFDIADSAGRASIMRKVTEIFRRFVAQKRYSLVPDSIRWDEDSASQTVTLSFKYINLESDRVEDFSTGFDAAGRTTLPTGR